jgi:hypothetical protein
MVAATANTPDYTAFTILRQERIPTVHRQARGPETNGSPCSGRTHCAPRMDGTASLANRDFVGVGARLWVRLLRRSPWKFTIGLPESSGAGPCA